jgi:hypothetical protein
MKIVLIIIVLILTSCNNYNIYQQRMNDRKEDSIKMFHEVHKVRKKCSSGRRTKKFRKKPKYTN